MSKNLTTIPRWPWVVLISTTQLALLLIAVVGLFAWLDDATISTMGQQTCLDNQLIGNQMIESIESEQILDVRSTKSRDRAQLDALIARTDLQSGGFVWLIDYGSGEMIGSRPEFESSSHELNDLALYSLTDDSCIGKLGNSISNQVAKRNVSGRLFWQQSEYFVNVQFLARLNAVVVVGSKRAIASQEIAGLMQQSKKTTFAVTLLLGLFGIGLTVIVVRRIGESVSNVNDGLERVVSTSAQELVKTKNAVIFGLAKLAESRDNDTGEHLERIRIYVTILAKDLSKNHAEFDSEFIHNLGLASSLHDIGKVGIPDSILLKPGRLTPEERGIMEIHTLIGGECLDAIHDRLGENEFMHMARQVAYHHHERWDGTGYPHSLKSTEIPIVARIVAVADVYDALTSKRPYKTAMTHSESKDIIVSGSGKHFDPEIVEAFLRHEDEFHEIALQHQNITDEEATSNFQRLCEAAKS